MPANAATSLAQRPVAFTTFSARIVPFGVTTSHSPTVELIGFGDRREAVHFRTVLACRFCKGVCDAGRIAVAGVGFEHDAFESIRIEDRRHVHRFLDRDELGIDAVAQALAADDFAGLDFLVAQAEPQLARFVEAALLVSFLAEGFVYVERVLLQI